MKQPGWPGDRFFELHLVADAELEEPGQQPELQFGRRYYHTGISQWLWQKLDFTALPNLPNPQDDWHTIAVEAVSNITETTFNCYLDGDYKFAATSS